METEVIDTPQTNEEHLKYIWKGVKMVAGSSAILAWRGIKTAYRTVAGWVSKAKNAHKGKEGSDTNANCTENEGPASTTAAA